MIHEYAIDPKILLSWASNKRDYAEFFREYGLGTPRIFSSFPKQKAPRLRQYLLQNSPPDIQSLHCRRYIEMVEKLVEVIVLRETPESPPTNWCEHVRVENSRMEFGAVLSIAPIETLRNVTLDGMYENNSGWHHPKQLSVKRTREDFSSAVVDLVRLSCQKVIVIDPYGWTSEAIDLMAHLVDCAMQGRVNQVIPDFILYFKAHQQSPSVVHVRDNILGGMKFQVHGIRLSVVELTEVDGSDVFHNRCILTEHGGVITGHGIGVPDEDVHTDELLLMSSEIYMKKWKQFVDGGCFKETSRV